MLVNKLCRLLLANWEVMLVRVRQLVCALALLIFDDSIALGTFINSIKASTLTQQLLINGVRRNSLLLQRLRTFDLSSFCLLRRNIIQCECVFQFSHIYLKKFLHLLLRWTTEATHLSSTLLLPLQFAKLSHILQIILSFTSSITKPHRQRNPQKNQ